MKKILLICLFIPVFGFSQKIKIKKDIVSFDDNEVAVLKTPDANTYEFYYLNGDKAFTANFKGLSITSVDGEQWLEMVSTDNKKTEIPYEVLQTSFNSSKIIIRLLAEKYKLIDNNGINKSEVETFFNTERESLSDKYLKAAASAKMDRDEREQNVGKYNPFVKDDGTILFGGSFSKNIVGYAKFNNNIYTISDLDLNSVATATEASHISSTVKVKTYTDETFSYDYGSRTMITPTFSRTFAQLLVEELVGRGYYLGHQAKENYKALHAEKVKLAKERSANHYAEDGYVIDEDGKKYSGKIYAIFEPLQLDPDAKEPSLYDMDAIDKYGKFISVKYKNEKGQERIKKFSAKDKVTFCVTEDGEEHCYYGMKTKGNALKKLSNASNFGFDNSYFYELVHENNGHQLLIDTKEGFHVIKIKSENAGFMVDDRDNDKLSESLADYLEACKALDNSLKAKEFDLGNPDNLIQIIDEFAACKS